MPIPINISASRGAAILDLSSWSTPTNVWLKIMEARQPGFCKKNNYELPVFEESAVLRWGKAFESAVIELAEKKQNSEIIDREKFFSYGDSSLINKKITCHIDGLYEDVLGYDLHLINKILHEGKTTSFFYYKDNFGEPGTDQVPVEYQVQCQHQMICTGAEKVILSVLVFPKRVDEWEKNGLFIEGPDSYDYKIMNENMSVNLYPDLWAKTLDQMGYFYQYEIKAHPELQKIMIENYNEFWEKYVLTGQPPKPTNYDDIKMLIRNPVGTIVATENIERLMSEYKNIKSEIGTGGNLAKRTDQIKTKVLEWMNSMESIEDLDGKDAKKWILKDRAGKRIGSYGKNKNGRLIFR